MLKLSYTNKSVEDNYLKLVMPFSSSYHKMFITTEATGMLNLNMSLATEAEGQYIIEYAASPLFKLVASTYKKTSGFTPFVKQCLVPDLRNVKTDNLYDVFGLTAKEREYVDNIA